MYAVKTQQKVSFVPLYNVYLTHIAWFDLDTLVVGNTTEVKVVKIREKR